MRKQVKNAPQRICPINAVICEELKHKRSQQPTVVTKLAIIKVFLILSLSMRKFETRVKGINSIKQTL